MPFKSQAQRRKFYAMESRGQIPKGTAAHWEAATGKKKLPEHVKKSSAFQKALLRTLENEKVALVDPRKVEAIKQQIAKAVSKSRAASASRLSKAVPEISASPRVQQISRAFQMSPEDVAKLTIGGRVGPQFRPKLSSASAAFLKWSEERPGDTGGDKSKKLHGFHSKKQWRKFFAMEAKGQLPKGEAKEWAHDTPGRKGERYRKLPTKVSFDESIGDASNETKMKQRMREEREAECIDRIHRMKAAESLEQMEEKEEEEEERSNPVTMDEVREFIRNNTAPEDYELHSWAENKGVSPHSAEELLYQLAAQQVTGKKPVDMTSGGPEEDEEEEGEEKESMYFPKWAKELIPGGKAEGMPSSDFPAKQIQMGIKVEKEHTPSAAVAKEIAKDHLEEFKNYYTALDEMEQKLKQQKQSSFIQAVLKQSACATPGKKIRSKGKGRGLAIGKGKGPVGRMKESAVLTQAKREDIPKKQFALPKEEGYPIHDLAHARNALARVSQHGSPAERATVRKKVYARYPELKKHFEQREGKSPTSKGLYGTPEGYLYLNSILKAAAYRKKYAGGIDPLDEQRKMQVHEQQLQFSEDMHQLEMERQRLRMEQEQQMQSIKAQQQQESFQQDSAAKQEQQAQVQAMQSQQQQASQAPGAAQQAVQRRQNLMSSQSPPPQQ